MVAYMMAPPKRKHRKKSISGHYQKKKESIDEQMHRYEMWAKMVERARAIKRREEEEIKETKRKKRKPRRKPKKKDNVEEDNVEEPVPEPERKVKRKYDL